MEFLELIKRFAFKGLDLALRAGRGEKSYANWSIRTASLDSASVFGRRPRLLACHTIPLGFRVALTVSSYSQSLAYA